MLGGAASCTIAVTSWPKRSLGRPITKHVDDVGVLLQHVLDLFDEHLLAPGVHHQRVATEQHDLTVGCEPGAVAGNGDADPVDDREGRLRRASSSRYPSGTWSHVAIQPTSSSPGVEEARAIGGQETRGRPDREALLGG